MLVFFDIFAILLAAYSLVLLAKKLLEKKKTVKWLYAIVAVFFGIQGYFYTTYSLEFSGRHTIRKEEFDIVQNLDMLVPENATILSTHKGYTPWLLGYSKRRILAPGLLENQIWNEEKWNQFYYQANDTITRAEVAKIMVGILGVSAPSITKSDFSDVSPYNGLAKFIQKSKELGIFSGQEVGGKMIFRPGDSITRAEIAKVVALTFKL